MYSGAAARKRVSEQVTLAEARPITGTILNMGLGEAKPRSRTCGWLLLPLPPLPPVGSVGKAGITRAKRTRGASRLIVWKMAYCLHLPTTCTLWPYSTTLYTSLHPLKRSLRHLCVTRAKSRVQTDSLSLSLSFPACCLFSQILFYINPGNTVASEGLMKHLD